MQPAEVEQSLMGDASFDTKVIRVCQDLRGRKLLDTFVHEALHAIYPYLAEVEVERGGTEMANALITFFESLGENE